MEINKIEEKILNSLGEITTILVLFMPVGAAFVLFEAAETNFQDIIIATAGTIMVAAIATVFLLFKIYHRLDSLDNKISIQGVSDDG